jgi:chromosome partitioning protein
MFIISTVCKKGGCGKSSLTLMLGILFAKDGYRTAICDLDGQGNITNAFVEKPDSDPLCSNVFKWLSWSKRELGQKPEVIKTDRDNLWLIPSNSTMDMFEASSSNIQDNNILIKRGIRSLGDAFDVILFDCPPLLGKVTTNAIYASNNIIVVTQPEPDPVKGVRKVMEKLETMRIDKNGIKILGIVPNLVRENTRLHRTMMQEMKNDYGDLLYNSYVRNSITVPEAKLHGKAVVEYDLKSSVGQDAIAVYNETKFRLGIKQSQYGKD